MASPPSVAALVLYLRELIAPGHTLEGGIAHEYFRAPVRLERSGRAFDVAVGDMHGCTLYNDAHTRCHDATVGDVELATSARSDRIAVDVQRAAIEV